MNALTDEFGSDYDLVFAHAVFLHFKPEELKLVLNKCFSCLKPGGILAFSIKQGKGGDWVDDYLGAPRYFYFWEETGLREIVEAAGFSVEDVTKRTGTRNNKWLHVIAKK